MNSDNSTFLVITLILVLIYVFFTFLLFGYYHRKRALVPIKVSMLSFALFVIILIFLPLFTTDKYPHGIVAGLMIFAAVSSLFLFLYLKLIKKLAERDQWYKERNSNNMDE